LFLAGCQNQRRRDLPTKRPPKEREPPKKRAERYDEKLEKNEGRGAKPSLAGRMILKRVKGEKGGRNLVFVFDDPETVKCQQGAPPPSVAIQLNGRGKNGEKTWC